MFTSARVAHAQHQNGQSPLIISEFMANKGSALVTQVQNQSERPDWIEIHNRSQSAVDLQGWYLTDDSEELTKWHFPNIVLAPDTYTVVFASKKDLLHYPDNYPFYDGNHYHTNFQLNRDGEYLALVEPDGVTIAHAYTPTYPKQTGLVSYGVDRDGIQGYFLSPSPGLANSTADVTQMAESVQFHPARGFYDEPFAVMLSTDTPEAICYYTTDGSLPDVEKGTKYTYPIPIQTTTCLRVVATKSSYLTSEVMTHTYFFLDHVIQQTGEGWPDTWGHAGADYAMDPVIVQQEPTLREDLKSIPSVSLVMNTQDWFGGDKNMDTGGIYAHPEWEDSADPRAERVVSAEFLDPDPNGLGQFYINALVRIAGGSSTAGWKSDKLSMRLKFQEPIGPTKLEHALFGSTATQDFDTLVLDARLNNAWNYGNNDTQRRAAQYTRDQFVSDLHNAMGGYSPHGRHVHLYLNGLYWGLYNLHERPDESFAAAYLGGEKQEYDVVKHTEDIVVAGSNQTYRTMCNLAEKDLSVPSNYETLGTHLDIPGLIDYMLVNFYYGNTDWAHHNWYASYNRFDPAGRWRFHSWDAEKGMQNLFDNLTRQDNGYGSPTRLHQRLMANSEYRLQFADHVQRHCFHGGPLSVLGATALYQHRLDVVDRAVVAESARWGDNRMDQGGIRYTRDKHWIAQRDWLLQTYFPKRTDIVLDQLRARGAYPHIEAPVFRVNGFQQQGGPIASNDLLEISSASGSIWYTLDGNDPRQMNPSATVRLFTGPLNLIESTGVKARAVDGHTWSALNEALFAVGPVRDTLRITEIMYHPQDTGYSDDPNTEFIELQNIGTESIYLNRVQFTQGIYFTFPSLELAPEQYCLLVQDLDAFTARYGQGHLIAGQYSGSLSNKGERLELCDAIGDVIQELHYDDDWYKSTDGRGYSLTIRDARLPDLNKWSEKEGWQPSLTINGSPGSEK